MSNTSFKIEETSSSNQREKYNKQIFDPIHGHVDITPLMMKIIDTMEFQRLRDLKQLGATYYVFPSATHTRFEHSIGVSHLAKLVMLKIAEKKPELNITKRLIEMVQIAGLIHDIGHGPFSHLYDCYIINKDEPEHEERGKQIFLEMIQKYQLPITEKESQMIIDMIDPPEHLKYNWLYQIIANKINSIDVDKMDYIQRDCYHIGIQFNSDFSRIIHNVDVRKIKPPPSWKNNIQNFNSDNEKTVLCWPDKTQYDIYSLFSARYQLHKQVYNHSTVKAYEIIIRAIIKETLVMNPNHTFLELTDSMITCRFHNKLKNFQNILSSRQQPKLIGEFISHDNLNKSHGIQESEIMEKIHSIQNVCDKTNIQTKNEIIKIGFSSGDSENPLLNVYYYNNKNEHCFKLNPNAMSFNIPNVHQEIIYRLYVVNKIDESQIEKLIELWDKHFEFLE